MLRRNNSIAPSTGSSIQQQQDDANTKRKRMTLLAPSTRQKYRTQQTAKQHQSLKYTLFSILTVLILFSFYTLNKSSLYKQLPDKLQLRASSVHSASKEEDAWIDLKHVQKFNHDNIISDNPSRYSHLIVVAGHSVIIGGNLRDAAQSDNLWYELEYQKGVGLPEAIVNHIQAGIDVAFEDEDSSLLIFSGGETRADAGPSDEGESYYHTADALNLWKGSVRSRTLTEEFATDSFQNLMFSLCRFHEITGVYPLRVTVVSFTFKKHRFEQLHAKALHLPDFRYVGVDSEKTDLEASRKGEMENAVRYFEKDPYGCFTSELQQKREMRNPFRRTPGYSLSCPEMKELLNWCEPQIIPKEKVPW